MTYFSNLPYTTYEFNSYNYVMKDILKRSMFISEHKPYTELYMPYNIQDGETLQSIAMNLYSSPSYHWVVAIMNEIHDMNFEWPLDQSNLFSVCETKYGSDKYKTKHWVDSEGRVFGESKEYTQNYIEPVNPGVEGNQEYSRVTFEEFETQMNDEKRIINVLRPELLGDFVTQFNKSLNV